VLAELPPGRAAYLKSLRFIKSDFVDFLRIFRFQRDFIRARGRRRPRDRRPRSAGARDGFEIFVLAIVNELYFRRFDQAAARAEGRRRLKAKVELLRAFEGEPAPAPVRDVRLRAAAALFG
jgi:nicotinate phosphoribosyltransferase